MSGRYSVQLVVLTASLVTARVHAQTVPQQYIELEYEIEQGLEDCPNTVEFRSFVAKELGYDTFRRGAATGLRVHVGSTANGLEGTIDWTINAVSHVGERRFWARRTDCRKMMASMGFVVAVQLQLMANEQMNEPEAPAKIGGGAPPTEPPTGSQGTAVPTDTQFAVTMIPKSFTVSSALKSSETDWTMFAGAGPALGIGLAPTSLVQGRTFFDIRRDWVGFEVGGEITMPVTKRYTSNGGFQHQLRLGTLAACAWHGPLAFCGVAKLGRIQVQGIDLDVPASPTGFIAQTGPRLVYAIDLGDHLIFLGHIETMGLLTSWKVETNQIAVWTMPRFSSVAGIDVAVRF